MVNLAVIVQVFLVELKDGHNKFMVEIGVQQLEVVVVMVVAVVQDIMVVLEQVILLQRMVIVELVAVDQVIQEGLDHILHQM